MQIGPREEHRLCLRRLLLFLHHLGRTGGSRHQPRQCRSDRQNCHFRRSRVHLPQISLWPSPSVLLHLRDRQSRRIHGGQHLPLLSRQHRQSNLNGPELRQLDCPFLSRRTHQNDEADQKEDPSHEDLHLYHQQPPSLQVVLPEHRQDRLRNRGSALADQRVVFAPAAVRQSQIYRSLCLEKEEEPLLVSQVQVSKYKG